MIFGIHCNTIFQQTSNFPKFSVKTSCANFSGINFNYPYRPHLVLVIRTYFLQKFDLSRNTSSKNPDQIKIILSNMFNTKYYIKYNSKYTNYCYVFSFLHNLKPKTEVIID